VERADDDGVVDDAVGEGATSMWALGGKGPQGSVPEPEHRDLLVADLEGSSFPDGDVVCSHFLPTWGSTVRGRAVRN